MIKVRIEPQPGGIGYTLRPVSHMWTKSFHEHVVENGGPDEPSAYCEHLLELKEHISRTAFRDLDRGWHVVCMMDPWILGQFYGYDAYTVAERMAA